MRPRNKTTVLELIWVLSALSMLIVSLTQANYIQKQDFDIYYLFYSPILCILVMGWLWGTAINHFESRLIKYEFCFQPDHQQYLLNSISIFHILGTFSSVFVTCALLFTSLSISGFSEVASVVPIVMYFLLLLVLVNPIKMLHWEVRIFLLQVISRVFFPLYQVSFTEFILADIMTSLSTVFGDLSRAICVVYAGLQSLLWYQPQTDICSPVSYLQFFIQCYPYLVRFVQCIRIYYDTRDTSQLFNALKYASAFPVIALSILRSFYFSNNDQIKYNIATQTWLGLYLFNVLFFTYWDVERDWEIKLFSLFNIRKGTLDIKTERLYKNKNYYYYFIISNAILRFNRIYQYSMSSKNNQIMSVVSELSEIFRRFQWLLIRIETELRKIQHRQQISPPLLEARYSLPDRDIMSQNTNEQLPKPNHYHRGKGCNSSNNNSNSTDNQQQQFQGVSISSPQINA